VTPSLRVAFWHNFHIKSMFLGQNKYICGRFGGHMDILNTSTQSGGHKMRLNVSKWVPTVVTTFWSDR
jgi:hypothetical protein